MIKMTNFEQEQMLENQQVLQQSNKPKKIKPLTIILSIILVLMVFLLCFFTFICKPLVISGNSMYPTLNDGQLVFVLKTDKKPQLNDIIVYKKPNENISVIKRVVGVEGDTFAFNLNSWDQSSGFVGSIKKLNSSFEYPLSLEQFNSLKKLYPTQSFTVKKDEYFTVGDNKTTSLDGRNYGKISKNNIIGKKI